MAGSPIRRARREALLAQQSGGGSPDGDPGLSLQPKHEERSRGDAPPWLNGKESRKRMALRDDAGGSPSGAGREDIPSADPLHDGGLRPDSDGNGRGRKASPKRRVQGPGPAFDASLALLAHGHRPTAEEATPGDTAPRLREGHDLLTDQAKAFSELLDKSIKQAAAIMDIEVPMEDPNFARILSTKATIIGNVMNTASKIDENNLRRQSVDRFDELLESAKALQAQLRGPG